MSSSFSALTKAQEECGGKTVFPRPNNWNKRGKVGNQEIRNSGKTNEWEIRKKDAAGREVERQRQRGRDSRDGPTGLWREELNFPTPSVTSPWVESSTYVKPPTNHTPPAEQHRAMRDPTAFSLSVPCTFFFSTPISNSHPPTRILYSRHQHTLWAEINEAACIFSGS